jgi:hypothetical protein
MLGPLGQDAVAALGELEIDDVLAISSDVFRAK